MSDAENPALTTVFVDKRATKRKLRRARLVVVEGPDKGAELVIERERVTVGRSVICDLTLADKAVSGTHFEVEAKEAGFVVRDLDSTNGTYCGELRIKEVWARPGTMIRVGQSHLKFDPQKGTVDIELSNEERFHGIIGRSVRMREIFAILQKIAPTDLTVLVRGETGTGKELVARALHSASKRADEPLVVQDCSAIPKDLIESTLFGHERGAFTGASDRHRGSFEQADGGTIFLDEIGELDLGLQPKLLRVLENREIKRVGGDRQIAVNVRVVAATNRDLRQMVNEGTFREDLFYRLSVVQVELPALRDRPEDIPTLVEHFLSDLSVRRFGPDAETLTASKEAIRRMQAYPWPGNIRELKNSCERGGSLSDELELTVADLMPGAQKTVIPVLNTTSAEQFVEDGLPFKEAKQRILDEFEAAYLRHLLKQHDDNITRSAKAARADALSPARALEEIRHPRQLSNTVLVRRAVSIFALSVSAILVAATGLSAQQRLSVPRWARSVEVTRPGTTVRARPSNRSQRRGTVQVGTRMPLIGRVMGEGCPGGEWMQIGANAFVCESLVRYSPTAPGGDVLPRVPEGQLTPRHHAFVRTDGTWAYARAEDYFRDLWVESLGRGFGLAIVERRAVGRVEMARTMNGLWVPARELRFARPSDFAGVELEADQDVESVAWVIRPRAALRARPGGRIVERASRLMRVTIVDETQRNYYELSDGRFIHRRDVARPTRASVPSDVGEGERWIDVDTRTQTLTAYLGARPLFVTAVSTGRGANPTPRGVHRIWVKLAEDDMDDLEREDVSENYAIQAVPWVQYFEGSNGFHAAFWHDRFGLPRSHGCVNLSPTDARWLFAFTQPNMPPGWDAILPTDREPGTIVRVR